LLAEAAVVAEKKVAFITGIALGLDRFGRVDALIANAGIIRLSPGGDRDRTWSDIIDVNLTGV
jgi:NADP-dependent 3-hydroxy acid dehydrogenase YdfG